MGERMEVLNTPPSVVAYHGDCIEVMASMPDGCVDAVVCDPPYGLEFMGKEWDSFTKGGGVGWKAGQLTDTQNLPDGNVFKEKGFDRLPAFRGMTDEQRNNFQAWCVEWATEALRVLKPGGHILAFGGTRTWHRLAVAVEDVGFEIRDSIAWLYGSGFPKSHDVAKSIGKANLDGADEWEGWGTALKPAFEPVVVGRKPLGEKTVAKNVLKHGTGAINIDATRIAGPKGDGNWKGVTKKSAKEAIYEGGWDGSYQGEEPAQGRWPANVVIGHNDDCEMVGTTSDTFGGGAKASSGFVEGYEGDGFKATTVEVAQWACSPGCQVAILDEQSGAVGAAAPASGPTYSGKSKSGSMQGEFRGMGDTKPKFHADKGGASRFFYVAKASKKERSAGLDKNTHPTVKPVELMRWLIRLVTPRDGIVLDPFLGSGTTGVAAILEGFKFIGIEKTDEYLPIIEARLAWAQEQVSGK